MFNPEELVEDIKFITNQNRVFVMTLPTETDEEQKRSREFVAWLEKYIEEHSLTKKEDE